MLESRHQIKLAQQDLNGLFHNRRINVAGASLFIGLLPSAAAMLLCGEIVKDSTEGFLAPKEQAYLANWFRHIPESTLPTYTGVLLMSSLSGVPIVNFMPSMIIPLLTLTVIGYFPYLHRLPKDPGTQKSANRRQDALHLVQHLWSLVLILLLILVGDLSVVISVAIVILLELVIYRFHLREITHMIISAFEIKLLLNTFLVLVLKEFISYTGVLVELPDALTKLPIPTYFAFVLLFFIGGIISGASGIIALGTPLAFAGIDGGVPLMMLLMCVAHAASQLSPTHVCLVVIADYFHIGLGELIRKNLPRTLLFCALMIGYYQILLQIF